MALRAVASGSRDGLFQLQAAVLVLVLLASAAPAARSWSKEGHMLTCQIAQDLLEPDAAHAVRNLLPDDVGGDLSALCVWPDQVRHWYRYSWSGPLHFIDTPDKACTFDYSRDCHGPDGAKDMCVAGAIANFTSQLLHYKHGSADRRYNMTEALLFLSHFMGDVHQPMHVGFTSDQGGNSIDLRWFRHKSNLHHVWDREIIQTALAELYGKDMNTFRKQLEHNVTKGTWSNDVSAWRDCEDLLSCPTKYATESIGLACKWAYSGVTEGETLSDLNGGETMHEMKNGTVAFRRRVLRVEAADRVAAGRAGRREAGHVPQPHLRRRRPQPGLRRDTAILIDMYRLPWQRACAAADT